MWLPSDPAPTPESNRRRHGRVVLQEVRCSLGEVVDLSASGMRIRSRDKAPPKGSLICLNVSGAGEDFKILAQVTWSRRVGLFTSQIGVEFVDLGPAQRASLNTLARCVAHNEFMCREVRAMIDGNPRKHVG